MKLVLVAGDAMTDLYVHGSMTRMAPDAPAPVFKIDRYETRNGAAANVLANVRAMGADAMGLYSDSFDEGREVTKTRFFADGRQVMRVDDDRTQEPLSAKEVLDAAAFAEIVVLSDYGKGTLDNIGEIIFALKQAGKMVLVDPKSRRFKHYEGCDVLKPNLDEMRALVGGWSSDDELEHKVKALQRAANIGAVLLTRGADGMALYAGIVRHYLPMPIKVLDVCGAGDTAMAALAAALARGLSLSQAAHYANVAAGVAVSKFGTAVVEEQEVFA